MGTNVGTKQYCRFNLPLELLKPLSKFSLTKGFFP